MTPEELREIRENLKLSRPKFAEATHVSKNTLYRYEAGLSPIPYAYAFMVKAKYVN